MSQSTPVVLNYDDDILFGRRAEALRAVGRHNARISSDCVIFTIHTYAEKKEWIIRNLTAADKRLLNMFAGMDIKFPLPIQSYCWPQLSESKFPTVCVAPEGTGKTYAHLLYTISRCIRDVPASTTDQMIATENGFTFTTNEDTKVEDLTPHPKYIIICSSQNQVEQLLRHAEKMKERAYGPTAQPARCRSLPPVIRSVNSKHEKDKLMLRCVESQILVGTPHVLLKCFVSKFLNFHSCVSVIFDDLDVALQLHNYTIKNLMTIYLAQSQGKRTDLVNPSTCVVHMFLRKWTDLVKHFVAAVFPQVIIMFGSIAEAAIYAKLKFQLELSKPSASDHFKQLLKIIDTYSSQDSKKRIAVVCNTNDEARTLSMELQARGYGNKLYVVEDIYGLDRPARSHLRTRGDCIFVLSDDASLIETEVRMTTYPLQDITHIIHYSLPEDLVTFDQRFRLMFKNIQSKEKSLISTVITRQNLPARQAKLLYDLFCRSSTTENSTKLQMRDLVSTKSDKICFRFATTGVCRLEKLSKEDKFGAFCPDRHSVCGTQRENLPTSGQIRLTITHVVSPNEFYFWFEAHRDIGSERFSRYLNMGTKLMGTIQPLLDSHRDAAVHSVPLDDIRKGRIFGVYFQQEARVDRVILLDEPKHDDFNPLPSTCKRVSDVNVELERSKRVPAYKIDYGIKVDIFVRNLIRLPDSLTALEPQAHRGFNLGIRPADDEPNWIHKTKSAFTEALNKSPTQRVSAWLRLNSDGCFWLDNLEVSVPLINLDSGQECHITYPNRELLREGLAVPVEAGPQIIRPCVRLETISKWHADRLKQLIRYTTIRDDEKELDIYILNVESDFSVVFRKAKFNQQLINLENDLERDFKQGKLVPLSYIAEGVVCVAVLRAEGSQTLFNRGIIYKVSEEGSLQRPDERPQINVCLRCPDHADIQICSKDELYQIPCERLRQLPFQAIKSKMASVSPKLINDPQLGREVRESIMDISRDEQNQLLRLKCRIDYNGELYLYARPDPKANFFQIISHILSGIDERLDMHSDVPLAHKYECAIVEDYGDEVDESSGVSHAGELEYFETMLLLHVDNYIVEALNQAQANKKVTSVKEESDK